MNRSGAALIKLLIPETLKGRKRSIEVLLCQHGASLVEFALASAVFFSMLFGILLMSLALYSYDYVSAAAREGTRWAMVRGSTSCTNTPNLTKCGATRMDIITYVKGLGYPGIDATNIFVNPNWLYANGVNCTTGTCNVPGNAVQIQVTYTPTLNIPFLNAINLNLSSTSRVLISQ